MNLPLFIAGKLSLKSGSRRSPGIGIAIAGVAVAVTVMLVTLSVVRGFKKAIRDKVAGFESQLTISTMGADGMAEPFACDSSLIGAVKSVLGSDVDVATSLFTTVLLKTDDDFMGLTIKANSPGSEASLFIERNIVDGTMPDFDNQDSRNAIVISRATARSLNIGIGDKINTFFVEGDNVRTRRQQVAAIYDTSFGEHDKMMAFCGTDFLRSAAAVDSSYVSRIEINRLQFDDIRQASANLQDELANMFYEGRLDRFYRVDNVYHAGAVYFNWLELLDMNVIVIILLMTAVAGFTLVSCLFILILERVSTIGILKALGSTDSQVRKIFIYMALRIVVLGLLIGNIAGLGLLAAQSRWHFLSLDSSSYYLSSVPVEINFPIVILLNVAVIAAAWLILIVPAMTIARISPATTMKYE